MCFRSNDRFQNTFVYQPALDILELKNIKVTDYDLTWKSMGVYNSKLKTLYTAFMHSIKRSEYMMGIHFVKDLLAVEQKNYTRKFINIYIVFALDAWPRNLTNNLEFKNCFFWSN